MQLHSRLQLDAVSTTIYDCIMQFQCINTCESWPLWCSIYQADSSFQFPIPLEQLGVWNCIGVFRQISRACIVGLLRVKYQVDWKTPLETLITFHFHWRFPCSPGGLARSKETNAPDIRNFGQGLGGRNGTILVGLLFQDGVVPLNSWLLCLLCFPCDCSRRFIVTAAPNSQRIIQIRH